MKKILCMLSAVAMVAACSSDFDDAPLWESVNGLEERVGKLEELCRQMNTNLSAMKTIVDAVGSSDYVTGVTPVTKDGKVVGYTIAFYRHEPVTIYHGTDGQDGKDGVNGQDGKDGADGKDGVNGTDGKDGQDGRDGHSPVVSVRRDTDGNWYWTLDGEWLRDDSGNRIRANGRDGADGQDGADGTDGKDGQDGASGSDGKDGADGQNGITPQLKIENEYWYISYDNGRTWTMLGKATSGGDSGSGDGLFSGVDTSNADYVVFMLGDGTRIQLPTWSAFEALRTLCNQMNTNIESLRKLVEAVQNNDYITSVVPLTENGRVVGYTISFAHSPAIVIYHGKDGADGKDGVDGSDGKDGANGKDGHSPVVSVRRDTDGNWYWTLDGEWLRDANGDKVRANGRDGQDGADGKDGVNGSDGQDGQDGADGKDGITPRLKIENGRWMLSLDEGCTWTDLGPATGADGKDGQDGQDGADGKDGQDGKDGVNGQDGKDGKDGDSMFASVTVGEGEVTFVLSDGTSFSIPKDRPFGIEFADTEAVRFAPGSTYRVAYTLTGADAATEIEVLAQDGLRASIERTDESTGFVVVTTPLSIVERSAVIVLVSDGRGKTLMKSLNFVYDGAVDPNNGILIVTTAEPFVIGAAGGSVVVPLQTNLNYRVEIAPEAAAWLRLAPATRAALREETLTFTADANTSAMRRAFVYLIDLATETIAQTLCITQSGDEKALAETIRFVDPNFEKFLLANYDLDGDGKISKGEALEVVTLDVSKKDITDLTGLEWFTNLISLNVSNNSGIKTLDVTKLTALETLICYGCALADLDLKSNKALKYLSCYYYSGGGVYLTRLDLSQNKALNYLNCSSQHIAILDLSQNTELQEIHYSGSAYLQTLKIPNCSKLHTLQCYSQKLSTIDLSGCPELSILNIYSNNLVALDLSRNPKLVELRCYSNKLSNLNLSANPQLKTANIGSNPLTNLKLGNNFETFTMGVNGYSTFSSLKISAPSLKTLSLSERSGSSTGNSTYLLQDVDLSGCAKLETLSINGIPAEKIDISMLRNLKSFTMTYCTNLTALDLKANTELEDLSCGGDTSLKDLDITANLKLKSLNLLGTAIESLDLSTYKLLNSLTIWQMPNLHYLNLGDNPYITSFQENTAAGSMRYFETKRIKVVGSYLKTLEIGHHYNCEVQELDVTECPALVTLSFDGEMAEIDLSKNPLLKTLTCSGGLLTSLDLSANTALETVNCSVNKLRSLDVTRCEKLKTLSCSSNFLETLDVSGNLGLTSLNCSSMESLKTLFMDSSQRIRYITYERSTSYIPAQTEIVYR